MHHAILGRHRVDHKNGNGLDNRRNNLRPCTVSQNSANTPFRKKPASGFKGVYWEPSGKGRWVVWIQKEGKRTYLGRFLDKVEAAKVYDLAALEAFGEFAVINGV